MKPAKLRFDALALAIAFSRGNGKEARGKNTP